MKKRIIKYVVVVITMAVAGIIYSCGNSESIMLDESESIEMQADEEMNVSSNQVETESEKSIVVVFICGAVNSPDVYEFENGTRVIDAIKIAGGFREDADTDYLNLADTLIDGSKVYVPTVEEVKNGIVPQVNANESNTVSKSGKVNINTATLEDLKTLNGIGDKRAKDIIDYREKHGRFNSIEDVMLVPGIKEGAFAKICDDIEV